MHDSELSNQRQVHLKRLSLRPGRGEEAAGMRTRQSGLSKSQAIAFLCHDDLTAVGRSDGGECKALLLRCPVLGPRLAQVLLDSQSCPGEENGTQLLSSTHSLSACGAPPGNMRIPVLSLQRPSPLFSA